MNTRVPLLPKKPFVPQAAHEAVSVLNKLAQMEVGLVAASTSTTQGKSGLSISTGDGGNAQLSIPIVFNRPVPDAPSYTTATANASYNQAQVSALMAQVVALTNTVNQLLAQLAQTRQNPR